MMKWITQDFNTDQTSQDNFIRVKQYLSITPNNQCQVISQLLKKQIYHKQSHQQYIIYLKKQYLTHNHLLFNTHHKRLCTNYLTNNQYIIHSQPQYHIHNNKLYNTYLTNNQYKIHNHMLLQIHNRLLYNMISHKQYPIYHNLSTRDP